MPLPELLVVGVAVGLLLVLVLGPRRAFAVWRRFGRAVGDALARVVLTAFYFTVLVPFAAIARATRDPLGRRQAGSGNLWLRHGTSTTELDAARRQF